MTPDWHDTEERVRHALRHLAQDTSVQPDIDRLTESDPRSAEPAASSGRSRRMLPRKRVAVALAAGLTLVSGVAVASGVFNPDPAKVALVLGHVESVNEQATETPTEGLGTSTGQLVTSSVWCAYEGGRIGANTRPDVAIDQPMTEEDLVAACAEGPNSVQAGLEDMPAADAFTVCEAIVPADEIRRELAATADMPSWSDSVGTPILEGDPDGARPAFPFVLGWDADCAETTLPTVPAVELRPLSTLDPVNDAREVEVELQAAELEECLSRDRVKDLASHARSQLAAEWLVVDSTVHMGVMEDGTLERDFSDIACWSPPRIDPMRGTLDIAGWGG